MANKGITIAISGTYNGRALERAQQDLEKTRMKAISASGEAGSALINLGSAAAELGGNLHNAGYKMERFGTTATACITVPIAAAAAACATAAIDIDDSLTSVKKTVDGTEEEYEQLKTAAIEFSKTNAVSASQILDIQALGAQLGYATDELVGFSEVVSGLDIATDMDAETAATELAQFANITKMAHEDTANYGSTIVALGNNLATTESNISSMAQRLAAAGTQVGMSQADILGLAGAMSSLGLEAEAGGTALSTIISQIDKDIATSSDNVETWAAAAGMSAQEFAEAWKTDPVQALSALLAGMENATEEGGNMSVMLEELGVSSLRQTDALKRMAGNSELVADAVNLANSAWKDNTALQKEVDNRNASMSSRLQILKNKATAVAETVGTPLVNALLELVDAAEPMIQSVADIAQSFADMDEAEQKNILTMAGVAAGIGPVTTAAGGLVQGIGNVVTGFGKVAQKGGLLVNDFAQIGEAIELVSGGAGTLSEGFEYAKESTTLLSGAIGALPLAACAAALALVAKGLYDMHEHQVMVTEATEGLEGAFGAMKTAYDGYSGSADVAAASTSGVVDGILGLIDNAAACYDAQQKIKQGIDDVITSSDNCIQSQANLAGEIRDKWSSIGEDAALLDHYVDVINDLGGKAGLSKAELVKLKDAVDNYNQITGDSLEVIDNQTGALSRNKDEINATAEAYKRRAVAQAASEAYAEILKQQILDESELKKVQDALAKSNEDYANAQKMGWIPGMISANKQQVELAANERELQSAIDSAESTLNDMLDLMDGSGQTYATMQDALADVGVSLQDFGITTEEEFYAAKDVISGFESHFDGTLESIVESCNEYGVKIPQGLADAINDGKDVLKDESFDLGEYVQKGMAEGLEKNKGIVLDAEDSTIKGIVDAAKEQLQVKSPSRVFEDIGANVDKGLAQGIENESGTVDDAMTSVTKGIQGVMDSLPNWMQNLGKEAGSLLSDGLASLTGSAKQSGSKLSQSAQDGVSSVKSAMTNAGKTAGTNFSSAVKGVSAYASGQTLANSAKNGMGSVSASATGKNFAQGFSNGMSSINIWSAAYNIGLNALNAIKSALGIASPSKEAMKVGEWFGEGAILGMKSTESDLAAEAMKMSQAMSLTPEIYSNDYGLAGASLYSDSAQTQQKAPITFNVTINVNASNTQQATEIGRALGDELYLEYARKARANAWL